MYTKLLLRSILVMLFVTEVGFLVMLSGCNPYNYKQNKTAEIPYPTFYSAAELEARSLRVEVYSEPLVIVEKETTYINKQEYDCLVKNIYFEARNQSITGKQAIAVVTLERTKRKNYPNTICEVVKQKRKKNNKKVCQFSWYCDGKSDDPVLSSKEELAAWEKSKKIAEDALLGKIPPFLEGVTMFHADYVNPKWDYSKLEFVTKIDDHLFYKET